MKIKALLALALSCCLQIHGTIIYNNFGSNDSYFVFGEISGALGDGFIAIAVPFTPAQRTTLDRITVAMSDDGVAGTVSLTVEADVLGLPGGLALETLTLGGFPGGDGGVRTATSAGNPVLEAGVKYWIVAQADGTDVLRWHGAAAYGRAYQIVGGEPGWQADLESTYALRVEGTVVPTVEDLIALVKNSGLPLHRQRALLATLKRAKHSLARGHCRAAVRQLRAFQLQVRVQVGRKHPALAHSLTRTAQSVIETTCL